MFKIYITGLGLKTRHAAAVHLGVSDAFLSQLIAGTRLPSLQMAARIERLSGGAVPASSWVMEPEA